MTAFNDISYYGYFSRYNGFIEYFAVVFSGVLAILNDVKNVPILDDIMEIIEKKIRCG